MADTIVAIIVAAAAKRKIVGSRAEPDPVPLLNAEDMKTATPEKRYHYSEGWIGTSKPANKVEVVRG